MAKATPFDARLADAEAAEAKADAEYSRLTDEWLVARAEAQLAFDAAEPGEQAAVAAEVEQPIAAAHVRREKARRRLHRARVKRNSLALAVDEHRALGEARFHNALDPSKPLTLSELRELEAARP